MASKRATDVKAALQWLEAHGTERYRAQLSARFAIHTDKAFGTSMPDVQKLARTIGTDHELALLLWDTGWHEAKALATHLADPKAVTPALMDAWCKDFQNWADCDTACFLLFDKTPHAYAKVKQWAKRRPEFEKRAAFALLAGMALHDKKGPDKPFLELLSICEKAANDERNFVKKAVSWALRSMGSRSVACREAALEVAERLAASTDKTERWVGKDVLRDIRRPLIARRAEKRDAQRAAKRK
ncbi:MAG: DNA alkylation repair protein [Flavobacteriales bacterium]|nr:DNA alkylation repair protein [Flavobacteriales bacterium]